MSFSIMNWVFGLPEPRGSERLVLLSLASIADQNGVCWPSLQTIARMAAVDRRQAIRIVQSLESVGFISIVRRREGDKNRSNIYQFNCPEEILANKQSLPPEVRRAYENGAKGSKKKVQDIGGSDMGTTRGSDIPTTRGSDMGTTRVVVGMSPESLINNHIEPSLREERGENEFSPAPPQVSVGEVELFGVSESAPQEASIEDYFKKQKPPVIQESGSEESDGSAGGLIKNEGAFRALQRFEEKKGKIDVSRYPEDVRPVVYRFCQLSGMVPPEPSRKKGGEYSLWISSCRELLEAAGEFGPAAMEAVFKDRERERNPYSVYSPKSIVNAVRAKAGILRMESKKKASDEGITMTDAELARVEKETQEMMRAYFASIERKPQHDNLSV